MKGLIDSHAHLNDPRFAQDLSEVVERARQAGVTAVVNVGSVSYTHLIEQAGIITRQERYL